VANFYQESASSEPYQPDFNTEFEPVNSNYYDMTAIGSLRDPEVSGGSSYVILRNDGIA